LIGLGFETESEYDCFKSFVDNNRIYDEEYDEDIIPQEDDEDDTGC
jgi:hypothetical protein